ncbi:rod shape-determining protein MreD [Azonexus fungiphilus]|uniref:Rod shape-determining protein MreD n=1 Tax=Azonexus fungiphilus TaxID=146940 RepID=A0A495WAY2_9RHOO|nr:rod shape-determining protein MreD [Azonexus fungiphilus]NHC06569.1 rod shape-determining protein MreD [Azonexus fungiphilus]RKT58539.1 rod shape-determining protein MreD [Azonexus fungiphilus]
MQPTFSSSRILLPVRPWFIVFSLFAALLCNLLPTSHWPGIPDWVALVLCFWSVRESRRVGMGWAFILGLAMDVADGAVLGQHCVAYVLLAYVTAAQSRRILWFPLAQQALQILPVLLACQLIQLLMRTLVGADFPGWGYLIGPLVATVLWLPATFLLLLPQYQPVERDENRPL